ncbi:TPA: hypothetical protein ACGJ7A_004672 [Pseudomonas aeruginosa]
MDEAVSLLSNMQDSEIQTSEFRLWSIGRATENKPRNSFTLMVLPIESATATDGETTFNPVEEVVDGVDADGRAYTTKVSVSRDIPCIWLPNEDNRATPPDVMRGEKIAIYRLGDTSQFYWRSMGLSNDLRTLESVVYTFNASLSPGGAGKNFDTCYFMQFSAHDKHVTIGTSKANGEPYRYSVQINTGTGAVYILDDIGNRFELVSKDKRLMLMNADNSFVKVEKKAIDLNADQYIKLTSGGSTLELNPTEFKVNTTNTTIKSSGTHIQEAGSTMTHKAGGNMLFTAPRYDFT